ncbi:MAG TPA: hypothetical protein VK074_03500, partial [Fodinibius sp.]|nr:hypothetical protein [Fodinibius sp.]
EIAADYEYKYDLLRNYVLELIHHGQKLQPASALHSKHNAAERITSLFVELLERQFPIDSPNPFKKENVKQIVHIYLSILLFQ